MGLTFEWDSEKDEANLKKHGVSFSEAATVFADPLTITISDPDHSVGEERYITSPFLVCQALFIFFLEGIFN